MEHLRQESVPSSPAAGEKPTPSLCRFASVEMLLPYRHCACLANCFRAPLGVTVAQVFECIRSIRNPPPPAMEYFMLAHGPPNDADDEDQRPSFVTVDVFTTAAALAHSIAVTGAVEAITAVMDLPTARVWIGVVDDIPASYFPTRCGDIVYGQIPPPRDASSSARLPPPPTMLPQAMRPLGSAAPASVIRARDEDNFQVRSLCSPGGDAAAPLVSLAGSPAQETGTPSAYSLQQPTPDFRAASTTAVAATSPAAIGADNDVSDGLDDVTWTRAPRGDAVKHYRGPPRDPFSRRYWGDGRGVPLWVDADAPRPFGVLLAAACHSYGGERLIAPLSNNAAERQWQALDPLAVHPSIDNFLHGPRGAARPRFAYQHRPWVPARESAVVGALRDHMEVSAGRFTAPPTTATTTTTAPRAIMAPKPATTSTSAATNLQHHEQLDVSSSGASSTTTVDTTATTRHSAARRDSRDCDEQEHGLASSSSTFRFDVDSAAILTAVDLVLKTGARAESMVLPAPPPSAAATPGHQPTTVAADSAAVPAQPRMPQVPHGDRDRANFCASVYFLPSAASSTAPSTAASGSAPYAGPTKSQARRCYLEQRQYGGFVPCAGECVVAALPATLHAAGIGGADANAIGIIRTVSSWSRRKSAGGKNLTVVRRGATIEDVSRLLLQTGIVVAPLPREVAARVVVAASGDDVRRPFVTGRLWRAEPAVTPHQQPRHHPDEGLIGAVFVELSAEVPTATAAREACLAHVRQVATPLAKPTSDGESCIYFVGAPPHIGHPRR